MAESVNLMAFKMCAVCGQILDKIERSGQVGWGHAGELSGRSDHIAVPIDYDESVLVSLCDFCGDKVPLDKRHYLPVADFRVAFLRDAQGDEIRNSGGYNCCGHCAYLVNLDDWNRLIGRFMHLHPNVNSNTLTGITLLWRVVRENITGPVRPWRPGDERVAPRPQEA